jgi:caffeoyl-CoA O-methyltransferase
MIERETADRLKAYVEDRFAGEDEVLRALRREIGRRDIPEIYVSAEVGRLLQVLLTAIGALRVLEVGTLGGYSAIWMARALPEGGRLVTLELEAERAAVARDYVRRAGLDRVVEVRQGDARDLLVELAGTGEERFDAIFIDADKPSYPDYLEQALELVRPGGLIIADNAFLDGRILDPDPDEATRGILTYNRRVAEDPRLVSTVLPVRDGLAVSLVRS